MPDYTLSELMVVAAAREIEDGDVVFVGMRLPLIAFVVAKSTHAPNAVGVFENGVLRSTPARELIFTMSDGPNITGALSCLSLLECMALLQQGRVSLGFLGAAEADRYGNLNSTQVENAAGHSLRRHHDQSRPALFPGGRGLSALLPPRSHCGGGPGQHRLAVGRRARGFGNARPQQQ